jgi:tetratricopeptide (TPR) repeat protein
MRNIKIGLGFLAFALAVILGILLLTPTRMMEENVFTPLVKGYDFLAQGNYEAAKNEFRKAVEWDPSNPFALNNLAVLLEKEGKLNDALANLKNAMTHADAYKDQTERTCLVGGLCMAVKPKRGLGPTSSIAPIIQENIKMLEEKIGQAKTLPPPQAPPPMKER